MKYAFLAFILIFSVAHADQKSVHEEGKAFAKGQLTKQKNTTHKATAVPAFQTDRPAEAGMTLGQMEAQKSSILDQDKHAAFVAKTVNERPFIKIDPLHDPTIQHAQEAAANPEATIAQVETFETNQDQSTRHTCEESREDANYVCSQQRIIDTDVPPLKRHVVSLEVRAWRWRGSLGRNVITGVKLDQSAPHHKGKHEVYTKLINPLPEEADRVMHVRLLTTNHHVQVSDNGDVWVNVWGKKIKKTNSHEMLQLEITYRPKLTNPQIKEHTENACGPLVEKATKKLCRLTKEEITQGPETRDINGHQIYRPWWKKEFTYQCHVPARNTCEPYRQQGCDLVGTTCKSKMGDTCVLSEQTYLCRKKAKTCRKASDQGAPFCIEGNCSQPPSETNKDMMEAISRLSVLKDIQGEVTRDDLHVFKGGNKSCNNYITGFKNCCSDKGWGKSLGISGCSGEDEILAQNRSKHLCRMIGTYCSKKFAGKCIRKTTSFCCFPTRMARVFHEQGRAQLGIGWGDKKHPNCRGFTVDELTRIDFSKLDLRELYADIQQTMKKPDINKLNKSIHNRVETMLIDTEKGKGVKVG